jgi:hypothetical protein
MAEKLSNIEVLLLFFFNIGRSLRQEQLTVDSAAPKRQAEQKANQALYEGNDSLLNDCDVYGKSHFFPNQRLTGRLRGRIAKE